ncbi:MAG: hypothetical protein ABSF75_11140 [Terracidiphilus sp.]|jgi:hypothetical protein
MKIFGRILSPNPAPKTEAEIAALIEKFANGTGGRWDWDYFISTHFESERINWAQKECFKVEEEFPRTGRLGWCNEKGLDRLRTIAAELRTSAKTPTPEASGTAMDRGFHFEVIWNDDDVFEVRVSAWNGAFGGSADIYVAIHGLAEAAEKLEGFPRQPSDRRELQFGDFGPQSAGGAASMCFYCKDAAGHALVEARIESDHRGVNKAQSVVLVASIEANAVDSFVSDLRRLEADRRGIALLKVS